MSDIDSASIEFTLAELWMLHDVVRHDQDAISRKRWPVVATALNDDVALAILACEDGGLKAYTLELTRGDVLLLDFHVRRDMKTPEGARGMDILLKLFRARRDMLFGFRSADGASDESYKTALHRETVAAASEAADEVLNEFSEGEVEDADDGAS